MTASNDYTFMQSLREHVEMSAFGALEAFNVTDARGAAVKAGKAAVLDILLNCGGNQVYIPLKKNDGVFMSNLRGWVETAIRDALEAHACHDAEEIAQIQTETVLQGLFTEWGGNQFNIPLKCAERDEAIYEEMSNGVPANKLTRKYGVSHSTIYTIYKAELARKRGSKQKISAK